MALRFADGFDHYSISQITRKWTAYQSAKTSINSSGRITGSCLQIGDNSSGLTNGCNITIDSQSTWIITYYLKFETAAFQKLSGSYLHLAQFTDGSNNQCWIAYNCFEKKFESVKMTGAGSANFSPINTTYYNLFVPNQWYRIDIKVTIHNTAGTILLKVNGTTVINASSLDTRGNQSSNNNSNKIGIGSNNIAQGFLGWQGIVYVDDLYIMDTSGAANNDILGGDYKIETLIPSGNGADTDWTCSTGSNHAALVDDNPANDDTDYVSTNTANNKDTYTLPDLANANGTIAGAQTNIQARADDGVTTHTIAPILRHSGTDNVGTTTGNLTSSYVDYMQQYNVNPGTSSAFTVSDVNALECGVKLVA